MALTTIKRYRDLSEAIVARSLLESAGITANLCDENLVRLEWQISNVIGGIRLQVPSVDADVATGILNSPVPDSIDYGGKDGPYSQPRCPLPIAQHLRSGSLHTFRAHHARSRSMDLRHLRHPLGRNQITPNPPNPPTPRAKRETPLCRRPSRFAGQFREHNFWVIRTVRQIY